MIHSLKIIRSASFQFGRLVVALTLFLSICAVLASNAGAGDSRVILDPKDRRVLSNATESHWYSVEESQEASVSEIVHGLPIDVSDRLGGSDEKLLVPQNPINPGNSGSPRNSRTLFPKWLVDLLSMSFQVVAYVFGGLLLVLLAYVIYQLIFSNGGWYRSRKNKSFVSNKIRDQIRITDLPFELAATNLSLLEQSDYYRDRNDFSKAMVYFFSHLLVELNEAGLIRLARGKTNRLYVRELGDRNQIRQFLNLNIEKFERVFFGKYELDAAGFSRVRELLPEFEGWLKLAKNDFANRSSRNHE